MRDWELESHLAGIREAQERTARAQEEANRIARERGGSSKSQSLGLSWKTKLIIIAVIVALILIRFVVLGLLSEYETEVNALYQKYLEFVQNLTAQLL